MICTKCHKEFTAPLELYDGCVACPHCGKTLAAVEELRITADAQERFELSETYFYRSLELSNANINGRKSFGDSKRIEAEWRECIDLAVSHCRLAAAAGHPQALWRMGFYYDKDYVGIGSTEAQRCRIAYNFYATLCYYDAEKEVKVDRDVSSATDYNRESFEAIKKRAANDLLYMLYGAPEELSRYSRFDYAKNRAALVRIYGEGIGPAAKEKPKARDASDAPQGLITLSSCLGKTHVPLFGFFYVSKSALARMIDQTAAMDAARINETIYPMLSKRVLMIYFPCRAANRSVTDNCQEVYAEADVLARFKDNEYGGYLCFINGNGGYMPDKTLPRKVGPRLSGENSYILFKDMINALTVDGSAYFTNGLTFYGDDVIKYKKSGIMSYGEAVAKLCEDAVKGYGLKK